MPYNHYPVWDERILRSLRDHYKRLYQINTADYKSKALINISGQQVSDIISTAIRDGKPFVVSRFGSEEIKWYVHYLRLSSCYLARVWYYTTCKTETWKKEGRIIDNLTLQPKSLAMTEAYVRAMNSAIPEIDLLGSWLSLEQSPEIQKKLRCKQFAFLVDIEPYYHPEPWSAALEGKKVLVVHPMVKSIDSQYEKRKLLFANQMVLPEFELITLQAKYFDDPVYNTWQKIMNFYTDEVEGLEFDVAILGCGSWGMPLAAHIKRMGKPALHLGGATQVLFGIIGNRWETQYPGFTDRFVNKHWVRPLDEETPAWAKNYDKNSYW
jgi:hypothetical protein